MVGINEYRTVGKLDGATADARAVHKVLVERFGFDQANVHLLLDADATQRAIQTAVHSMIRLCEPDDRVLFYFAGHGMTMYGRRKDVGYIIPVDGDLSDMSTLVPWDGLVQTMSLVQAKHALFVLDACYGGLIGTRARAPGTARLVRDMLTRYSRQFLTAGKADEPVADGGGPRKGHSIFTGHLLEALEDDSLVSHGVLSASTVMARVYDSVGRDANSRQAPHHGHLEGDGDFYFLVPKLTPDQNVPHPAVDTMISVPANLVPQEEEPVPTSMIEQLKEYLSDRRYRIHLNDLVVRELRKAQQALGDDRFPVQSGASGAAFAERLGQYETAMSEVLKIAVLLGRWSDQEQQLVVGQLVNTLAGNIEPSGGMTLWLSLRYYPMLLAMYTGGMAAVESGNYVALRTLFATTVGSPRNSSHKPVLVSTCEAMLDLARMDAFKHVPGHERNHTPQSEYLYKRLQPIIEDQLFVGKKYDALFDRFELLYALCHADFTNDYWGHPGRFCWKRLHGRDPFSELVAEAEKAGDAWPPLKAGLFDGKLSRFQAVATMFRDGLLDKLNWY